MKNFNKTPKAYKKRLALILMLFACFCLILLTNAGKTQFPVSSAVVSTILFPFQWGISQMTNKIIETGNFLSNVMSIYDENQALKNEIEALRKENLKASEYAAENKRLSDLLHYKNSNSQLDLVAAKVIGRENATWSSTIVIDKGFADDVKDFMPIVTDKGLVGHVIEVGPVSSKVQLILDPRSSVGALVGRSESRVMGIVEGDISNANMPRMVNIPIASDIQEDDMIITSGFGGIYPKGIIIGKVAELKNAPGGLLKYATINTSVDFQKLEEVMIIHTWREPPPASEKSQATDIK